MSESVIKWENGPYAIELPEIHVSSGHVGVGISAVTGEKIYISIANGPNRVQHRHLTPDAARHLAKLLIKTADEFEGNGL